MNLYLIVMFVCLWQPVLRCGHFALRSRLVLNEISRNKEVLPEGAVGVNFNFGSFRLVEFPFTLIYNVVLFGMTRFLLTDPSLIENMGVHVFWGPGVA